MKTDIQIAQEAEMLHIREVAAKVGRHDLYFPAAARTDQLIFRQICSTVHTFHCLSSPSGIILLLEQSGNFTVFYINSICCRYFRKTRHGHDCSGKSNNKSCSCIYIDFTDMDIKVLRTSKKLRIIGQRILVLCHTYRELAKAH